MPQNLLSDRKIQNATPRDREYLIADGDGLFLRVRPTGAKDWLFVYTFAATRRKIGFGNLDSVALATARDLARQARDTLARNLDPQVERAARIAEQEAQRRRLTVAGLFDRWAEAELSTRKDGGAEVRRMAEKDVLPALGKMMLEDVRKGDVVAVVDKVRARGVERMPAIIFSLLRQMFRFAVDRDYLEVDPTSAIRKARLVGTHTERERVLSEAEITTLAELLPRSGMKPANCAAVWIALSTAARIGEILKAEWQHLDFTAGTWLIPAEHSKNGRPHTVYLSRFALRWWRVALAEANRPPECADDPQPTTPARWCFPNRDRDGPVDEKTVTKQVADRQRGPGTPRLKGRAKGTAALVLPGGQWRPHDLRRTGATMMTAVGVLPEVAERCLNHAEENRIKRTYQRHNYAPEMKEAWRLLGQRLEALTDDALELI